MISRAAALLRELGRAGDRGASTTELARNVAIPRPTVHRMLVALADEGLVDRASDSAAWFLGPEMYLLGSVAASRYDTAPQAVEVLRGLARDTAESAFLSARRGDESVCVSAEEGSFPLRSHVLHPGKRFPLGVASAGLVMLAHSPDREIDAYLDRVDLQAAWGPGHTATAIRRRIRQTRLTGYAVNPGLLVEGSWGVGAAVFDELGRPRWALSLTGVESRFNGRRQKQLGESLLRAAHVLTRRLAKR
ncbi:IclR family transcriptional regulator [Mycobacterium sp. GA-2829]|nr:IclR family transcriptional regulator [Mycobacterium sp. GA-2829]